MEKRYLCPVCERELTAGIYCPDCHRLRREHLVYTGGLLPNEEDDSEFLLEARPAMDGEKPSSGQVPPAGKEKSVAARARAGQDSPDRDFYKAYRDSCGDPKPHQYGIPNVDPHRARERAQKRTKRITRVIVAVWVLVILVILVSGPVMELIEDRRAETVETQTEAPAFQTFSDSQVIQEGEPCSGYFHYDVDGSDYVARIEDYIRVLLSGSSVSGSEGESYNYSDGEKTYYESRYFIDVEADGEYPYVTVIRDTATGEVMSVSVSAESRQVFQRMLLAAASALSQETDREAVWEQIQDVTEEAPSGEYRTVQLDISEVSLYLEDGYCSAVFSCLEEYDKYGKL